MLNAFGRHGLFDLTVHAQGDVEVDAHHTVEDVGIVLGEAFALALGDKVEITFPEKLRMKLLQKIGRIRNRYAT